MHTPKSSQMDAAYKVVRYVKQANGFFSATPSNQLQAFCDADLGACPNATKSNIGDLIKFGDSPVSWVSKKRSSISRSCGAAEYMSLGSIVAKLVWLTSLLNVDLILPVPSSVIAS